MVLKTLSGLTGFYNVSKIVFYVKACLGSYSNTPIRGLSTIFKKASETSKPQIRVYSSNSKQFFRQENHLEYTIYYILF